MEVSIIIVSWNTKRITRSCLQSIQKSCSSIEHEIILIDNNSTDGSQEMVKNRFPEVNLIENTKNFGFAAANNQGIALAKGRYILLLNSDAILLPGALKKTIKLADRNPHAGVVSCRILNNNQTVQPNCFMFPSLLNLILSALYLYKIWPKNKFFGRELMTWWDHNAQKEVEVIRGCFMLVRKEAIIQVGNMDSSYFMYCEETDWCWQFKQHNWKVLFSPCADIIHLGKQSSNQEQYAMILQLKSSILYFFYKNRSRFSYHVACILVSVWFFIRLFPWLLKTILNPKHNKETLSTYVKGAFLSLGGWQALSMESYMNQK